MPDGSEAPFIQILMNGEPLDMVTNTLEFYYDDLQIDNNLKDRTLTLTATNVRYWEMPRQIEIQGVTDGDL